MKSSKLDEVGVSLKARRHTRRLSAADASLPVDRYLEKLGLQTEFVIRLDDSLAEDEAGRTVPIGDKHVIILNANDRPERQRFTAFHEVAHVVLGLPTEHNAKCEAFARRSPNEILCDVFAAELLLPGHLARPVVEDSDFGFQAIEDLAQKFSASLAAAGSRFAVLCSRPCFFVLTKHGIVRYASRSTGMRQFGGWIRPGQAPPTTSMAARLTRSPNLDGPVEIDAVDWLDDWTRGGFLLEDSRHFARFNQTLSLLWFEDDDRVGHEREYSDVVDDEDALRPLDGVLPWPGKRKRR